jgi:predicted metalloprotease with PDZ domain
MATLQLTQVYLEREQKKGLQARAKANGTKVAEEVRRAVDAYLAGISPGDLLLLDEGTRKAQRHLAEMASDLDRVNAKLDAAFARLDQGRRERKVTR